MDDIRIKTAALIDYPIFSVGFADLLKHIKTVTYTGNTVRSKLSTFLSKNPVDIFFLGTDNDQIARDIICEELRAFRPKIKVAVFLNAIDSDTIKCYMDAGVNGLIVKSIERIELEYAIKVIHKSGLFVSQEISSAVFGSLINNKVNHVEEKMKKYHLTPRELEIMLLVYQEYSNNEIARQLSISHRTVEAHRTNILNKTGVKNGIGLAKFVIEHKLDKQTVPV